MSKILKVCFKESLYESFNQNDSKYFKVTDNFNVNVGDLILVEPKYKKDINLNLGLCLEVTEIEDLLDEGLKFTDLGYRSSEPYIIPFFISTVNLDVYKEQREKIAKKNKIEKQLDEATKKLEKVAKYKALADLNPEFKAIYDEYIGLISEDKNLLN